MYERILLPTDESDGARAALDHALDIATTYEATIYLLNVADTAQLSATRVQGDVVDALEQEGERTVSEAAQRAERRGATVVTEVIQGEPDDTIVEYADAHDIDLVVMPTHGRRGLEQYLLGSTTERVIRRSEVPVLTVPVGPSSTIEYPYRNVLVPTDGSNCAGHALEKGIDIASTEHAELHLLSVVALTTFGMEVQDVLGTKDLEKRANGLIEEASGVAREAGVESVSGTVEQESSIGQAVLSYVDERDVDLVVVGTHGRTGFERYILGSVTERLVRTAPVPVLTVGAQKD